jgi:3-dehydroquinate synthase
MAKSKSSLSTHLVFRDRLEGLTRLFKPEQTLLIHDRRLESAVPGFKKAVKGFRFRYSVHSGEELKSLQKFPEHVRKLMKLSESLSPRQMTIVAIGGGSVGDFAGFFASVYKRGVSLVHVPSTWLAAIDSSHGGKTALNAGGLKNQIGTFYLAEQTILVRSLLQEQPEERVLDAMGEFAKTVLFDGSRWTREIENSSLEGGALLWKFLKPSIESKMRVVARDPHELKGERQILNLGHTMGHVFESKFGWLHGQAVAQGLFFALEYSENEGLLSKAQHDRALRLMSERMGITPVRPKKLLTASEVETALLQDKKRSGTGKITFIFLRRFGKAERRSIPISALVREARRQGWVGGR